MENSHRSMEVRFYDSNQPIMVSAYLRRYSNGASDWHFGFWNKDNKTVVIHCDLNELISLVLLGKALQNNMQSADTEVKVAVNNPASS